MFRFSPPLLLTTGQTTSETVVVEGTIVGLVATTDTPAVLSIQQGFDYWYTLQLPATGVIAVSATTDNPNICLLLPPLYFNNANLRVRYSVPQTVDHVIRFLLDYEL